jgi:fructuronate reductase
MPSVGVVHFGASAFHRAHQAAYIDTVLHHDPRWGIAAVSLRTRGIIDALARQEGLYTLALRDREPGYRIIAAHTHFLGPEDGDTTSALLADSRVGLVTTTVTEKGYCLAGDGTLDFGHPDIAHDLSEVAFPRSVIGWIVRGLAARRQAGAAPFVVMPCDNLPANGRKLHAALEAFARCRDSSSADWIASEVRVPGTMVDAITPASDEPLYADVAAAIGCEDRAAVQRERFAQWVIEDIGPLGPDLRGTGAIVTSDVAAFEQAKLRILNGAHSTLAYAGLLRGHGTVEDAMGDPPLARFVAAMIREEIIPTLPRHPGLDLHEYAASVLDRFRNPGIVHRLDQIAQDGSQKLPYRLGDTLLANLERGRTPTRVLSAFGCWIAFLMHQARRGVPIIDPQGDELAAAAKEGSSRQVIDRINQVCAALPPAVTHGHTLAVAVEAAARRDWATLLGD